MRTYRLVNPPINEDAGNCRMCYKYVVPLVSRYIVWVEDSMLKDEVYPLYCLSCGVKEMEENLPIELEIWNSPGYKHSTFIIKDPAELILWVM